MAHNDTPTTRDMLSDLEIAAHGEFQDHPTHANKIDLLAIREAIIAFDRRMVRGTRRPIPGSRLDRLASIEGAIAASKIQHNTTLHLTRIPHAQFIAG